MTGVTLYSLADMAANATERQVFQENPKFKSLFNQLEYGPEARIAIAEAFMHVSKDYDLPQKAFFNNNNVIIFTDEDMEVAFPDH
ncbi:Retrovirus-related Pol polyprotein from transposon 17.6 [Pyrus ussuriensis x Pyrus communis]|uniref:Retrovirus-related Pol polyprotein from transposon 17.6 n=1 Tax=Pyrus ussuriensis x Pyrus communis TaxID=2448454 RepID=A0A5N5HT87_9ROSA|nr:Retrovirus-related Pol polyprotein from transposon 17.6 [Pyrus ussuriensis x Pyrus communis]